MDELEAFFTPTQLNRRLLKRLVALGWEPQVSDICWMACDRPGYEMRRETRRIALCRQHIDELEQQRASGSYASSSWPWDVDS